MTRAAAAATPILLPRTLGEALVVMRHRAGLGRDETAHAAEIGEGTLSRYEKDLTDRPDLAAIRRVTVVLTARTGDDLGMLWGEIGTLLDSGHATGASNGNGNGRHDYSR